MRPVHHMVIRNHTRLRSLVLEPTGMVLDLIVDDEVRVELIGGDPPELDIDDQLTCWSGVGSEIRVLRGSEELYSTIGNPVPDVPEGSSVRDLVTAIRPRRN